MAGHPQQPKFLFFTNTEPLSFVCDRHHWILNQVQPRVTCHLSHRVPVQFLFFLLCTSLSFFFSCCQDTSTLLFPGPDPSISYRFGRRVKKNQHLPIRSIITRLDATTGFPNLLPYLTNEPGPSWLQVTYPRPPGHLSRLSSAWRLEPSHSSTCHLSKIPPTFF
ncbi:uncharacterized protein B0T23DRAFT_159853 [Neurospora hispaniola]|uniref:Uncharacterized protein n=1 Tax=Neurospora hispaniola TaxID=588809 RepID=A0AAJ0MQ07_9PEZI|nr:hypothetical protein B0T23DRAFT_159853 [Neurospora hispaniola]